MSPLGQPRHHDRMDTTQETRYHSGVRATFDQVVESLDKQALVKELSSKQLLVASRVIGAFEDTIDKLVALAALMPIIASVGGNTGNQTAALSIRRLALDQAGPVNGSRFLLKERGMGS